ncbi:hypothetical protein OIU85_014112 [Salix viminalis]|uniref:Uncharacterized protein n=1 Tax=Salix viminalis TaxID=40686 RepID=A0A9Q0NNB9_SALVM|nr:hypothetical protein OIU85_014112 [Salix viminalis]
MPVHVRLFTSSSRIYTPTFRYAARSHCLICPLSTPPPFKPATPVIIRVIRYQPPRIFTVSMFQPTARSFSVHNDGTIMNISIIHIRFQRYSCLMSNPHPYPIHRPIRSLLPATPSVPNHVCSAQTNESNRSGKPSGIRLNSQIRRRSEQHQFRRAERMFVHHPNRSNAKCPTPVRSTTPDSVRVRSRHCNRRKKKHFHVLPLLNSH